MWSLHYPENDYDSFTYVMLYWRLEYTVIKTTILLHIFR